MQMIVQDVLYKFAHSLFRSGVISPDFDYLTLDQVKTGVSSHAESSGNVYFQFQNDLKLLFQDFRNIRSVAER